MKEKPVKYEYRVICFGFDLNYVLEPSHMEELLNREGREGFDLYSIQYMENSMYGNAAWYAFLKKPCGDE